MEDVTTQAPETSNSLTLPTDIVGGVDNLLHAAGESSPPTIIMPTATATVDNSSPPPPDDDTSPPPEPTPTPAPPPPDSSPPPPPTPSPPPPTLSSPPPPQPISSSPPPPATIAASPPPPETDSPPPPETPVADSPPPPITDQDTPSSDQLPTRLPPSTVPSGTTSPSRPAPKGKTTTTPSRPSRSGGGSPGKGLPSSPAASDSTNNSGLIIGLVITCVIILALVIIGVICCCKRKKKNQMYSLAPGGGHLHGKHRPSNRNMKGEHIVNLPAPPGSGGIPSGEYNSFGYSGGPNPGVPLSPNISLGVNTCSFTLQDLSAATGGFSEANVIGQGGFGYVFKGVLPNGKEVAVKSLKAGSGQGEREFQAEVEIISRVHHRYLVSLVGYCIAEGQRILVYDFVPNKTLEFHLHGEGQPTMDWGTRLKIATGSARGLAYLHEDCHPRIIHRDIKAANILIDYNFEAQVADFGLAKLSVDNNTHVSTRVMGTFGYLAPEYASSGKLSEKSDVFSFGVMLLELITGRRPVDHTGKIMEDSLVDWARPHLIKAQEDGNYAGIADPHMEGRYDQNEMARMVACASSSVRHSARKRPKMSQIVRALEGDLSFEALNDSKPGQGMGVNGNDTSAYDTGEYNADMMKFRKMVMSNQDFDSSEYSDSNEYGLNPSVSSSDDSREMPAKPRF